MKRFTQSIIAISAVAASAISTVQASESGHGLTLSGISSGDLESELVYNHKNQLISVESLASKVTYDYAPASLDDRTYDMTMRISDPSGDIVCYLEIGDNGYVTKSVEIEEVMGEQAPYKTYTFSYDADGHLTKINEIGEIEFATTTFEYAGGNIVSADITGYRPQSIEIAYTSDAVKEEIANTAGVMDYETFGFNGIEARYFTYAGLLGAPTADLPVVTEMTRDGVTTTDSYLWTTDSQGTPTSRNIFCNNAYKGATGYAWTANTSLMADACHDSSSEIYYDINGIRHNSPVDGINITADSEGHASKAIFR